MAATAKTKNNRAPPAVTSLNHPSQLVAGDQFPSLLLLPRPAYASPTHRVTCLLAHHAGISLFALIGSN